MGSGRVLLGGLLLLTLSACQVVQGEAPGGGSVTPASGGLQFFACAEHQRVVVATPSVDALSVSSPVADVEAHLSYLLIEPTDAALRRRWPEQVGGYGDITAFHRAGVTYDAARQIATIAYASAKWNPQAGSMVCAYDDGQELVLETEWLTDFDYGGDCCMLVLVRQTASDGTTQPDLYRVGSDAMVKTVAIEDSCGEFVAGYWAVEPAEASEAQERTLRWINGDTYWTLRWRACDRLFEMRTKGQDGDAGFLFEDLIFIARDIHAQVVCDGDFEEIQKRKRLRATAHGEARPSPGVDEEAKSLRGRYRRFRAAQNRFDCP
jgi:hypothetical protein